MSRRERYTLRDRWDARFQWSINIRPPRKVPQVMRHDCVIIKASVAMRTFRHRCIIAFRSAGVVRWLQCGFSGGNSYLFRCKIQSVGWWLRLWRRRLPVASRQPSTQVGRSGAHGYYGHAVG